MPLDWKIANEIYGIEVTAFGPIKAGEREAISFVFLDINKKTEQTALLNNRDEYRLGRESYVLNKKGSILKIENPQKILGSTTIKAIYRMSVKYKIGTTTFDEYSFLIECNSSLVQVKGMKRNSNNEEFENMIYKVIDTVECK